MRTSSQLRHGLRAVSGIAFLVTSAPLLACETIRFQRGDSSATVSGVAPPETVVCYKMATGAGQRATLRITGRNMMFSVEGVVEAQVEHSFTTKKTTYRINVVQLMRSVTSEPFSLFVSVR